MTEVAAALILGKNEQGKTTFLIFRRPEYKARGLLWEFVGGKLEKGETGREALKRECLEELGIEVAAGDVFFDVFHEYPDIKIHLTVYYTTIVSGEIQLLEHTDMRAITVDRIDDFDFCPADKDILENIKALFG